MSHKHPFDWSGFVVHFVFGAPFGAIVGFAMWGKSSFTESTSMTPGWFFIGGGALVCGLIAGFLGDRFWQGIGDWFR